MEYVLIWWLVGMVSLAVMLRGEKCITVRDVIAMSLAALAGPVMAAIAIHSFKPFRRLLDYKVWSRQ